MDYVQCIWILLSILEANVCSFCFLQPEWILNTNLQDSFGIYAFCLKKNGVNDAPRICGFYGGRFGFGNIPSTIWQAAFLLYGGGTLFACFGAFCSLSTMCIEASWNKTLLLSTRCLQITSVFLMTSGLVIYPFSFGSSYFRSYCGDGSDVYNTGTCHVGWTFVLAVVAAAISIFCPILSYFCTSDTDNSRVTLKLW